MAFNQDILDKIAGITNLILLVWIIWMIYFVSKKQEKVAEIRQKKLRDFTYLDHKISSFRQSNSIASNKSLRDRLMQGIQA